MNFIRNAVSTDSKLLALSVLLAVGGSACAVSNNTLKICGITSFGRYDIVYPSERVVRDDLSTDWRAGAIREFTIARSFISGDDCPNIDYILMNLYTDFDLFPSNINCKIM